MYAEVILAQSLIKTLTYRVPQHMKVKVGQAVVVPIRNRHVLSYVFRLYESITPVGYEIKDILDVKTENSLFDQKVAELIDWLSAYYVTPLPTILNAILPLGARTLDKFKIDVDKLKSDYAIKTGKFEPLNKLNKEQAVVFQRIVNNPNKHHLIHGITGSGKTEVYSSLIHYYYQLGKSSMLLVPEISLIFALHNKLKETYGELVVVLHSRVTPKEKREAWLKIFHNPQTIVLGTRSAVFSPIRNLGVIIIDEEQDYSYKQEQMPKYNAKVVAFKKAQLEKAQVVFGTATPLISTYFQAKQNYIISTINNRYLNVPQAQVQVVDIKKSSSYPKNLLSLELVRAMKQTLDKGEQIILFFNQRGLSRFVQCQDCGQPLVCRRCSVTLTPHEQGLLKCHYCGLQEHVEVCPSCSSTKLHKIGKGVQALQSEIKRTFPSANIKRVDSDVAGKGNYLEDTLQEFAQHKIDIIFGTQMLAKGHHFPLVTLVGVINADLSLYLPDVYAPERTFDLLVQILGRAGRGERLGTVIVQTTNPEHYAIKAALKGEYEQFYNHEVGLRKETNNPPFSRLIRVCFDNKDNEIVEGEINILYNEIKVNFSDPDIELLEPVPSLINKIKNRYRWHYLIKFPSHKDVLPLKAFLMKVLAEKKYKSRISYDVDPLNMLL